MDLAVLGKLFHDYGRWSIGLLLLAALAAVWRWFKEQEVDFRFHLRTKRKE
jgi:hypothetical protein